MKKYLQLIRIKHWIKNLLIMVPMFYGKVLTYHNISITILGFIIFSFLSSFVYIINDIKDIEKDKLHPQKKNRPIPSGKISQNLALFIAIILLVMSFVLNFVEYP